MLDFAFVTQITEKFGISNKFGFSRFYFEFDIVLIHMGLLFWHFLFFWQFLVYALIGLVFRLFCENLVIQVLLYGIITCYIYTYFMDTQYTRGGRSCPTFVNSFIVQYTFRWFPFQIIRTKELSPSRQYIFGLHPHGLMPWGMFPVGRAKQWQDLFPGINIRSLAADILFKIPIAREATLLIGGVSASLPSARYALSHGFSLGVIPGGVEEMFESQPKQDVLILTKRRGFVRLAMENGTDLVPCYCFGVTDLYEQLSFAKSARMWLFKKTRIGFTFGWGRSFYSILPEKRPIYIVVGKPIQVMKYVNPSDEEVQLVLKKYTKKLKKLYYDHKSKIPGYEDRELVIV